MFSEFNFNLLNDPDFKEDSVREELILPIIKELGYQLSGDARIVRSKSLIHPYVALGSKQRKVSIVPDYLFLSDGSPYWVLDAKSPTEDIVKSKHVEQAYSYAIHPEVRAEFFALCNGKEFVVYSTKKFEPILHFSLCDIHENWEMLFRILNPEIRANPDVVNYHPDYGVHLRRLGAEKGFQFIGLAINTNHISKVEEGLYTASTVVTTEQEYALSLDFGQRQLKKLLKILPAHQAKKIKKGLKRQPYIVYSKDEDFKFGVVAEMKNRILHNSEESYLPFKVTQFMHYMESESGE
ncbi:type I restriction enzyme HsdR N-terminal domain-containing protein [Vreelandella boliviensis]|uniref:type I restriction enzyme HsdR N-terminal domain-containing protein n=1 Tax=Vreelandella boliviensis TaxID=223527 RepID=UPI001B8C2603|nr:type I restriction enzyme HsdR N-terminal domain-containing protein [Halomonas boliviensis]MBS3668556.1 type I restriction enzyme HsdR N-terminal domain-containing protein [Halomonas boliviensis]